MSNPPKPHWYRWLVAPKTCWMFARHFRLVDEPRWIRYALRFTWKTL